MRRWRVCLIMTVAAWLAAGGVWADPEETVGAKDSGPQHTLASWQCQAGHKIETRMLTLQNSVRKYVFQMTGCLDPSHGEQRPASEGNFGMPEPSACNWYWGGFLKVLINGVNATAYRVVDVRVTEQGARGSVQILWAHPDAEVGLRLVMLPGSNHVLALLRWTPRPGATLKDVKVQLTCYPSFFTSARARVGERHCQTPRQDVKQSQTLTLDPAQDIYLYYYDAVFDVAAGEGSGPCGALVDPRGVKGGKVVISTYPVQTELDLDPAAGEMRLGLYDFTGLTNAEAEAYLKAQGAADQARLVALDFTPLGVQKLDLPALRAEGEKLLVAAAEDGKALQPKMKELLTRAEALQSKAAAGDWQAQADLVALLEGSQDMFWKLRAFAALNQPE